jgi:hypothetical protein
MAAVKKCSFTAHITILNPSIGTLDAVISNSFFFLLGHPGSPLVFEGLGLA